MTTNPNPRPKRRSKQGDKPTHYEDGTPVDYTAKLKPAPSGGEEP